MTPDRDHTGTALICLILGLVGMGLLIGAPTLSDKQMLAGMLVFGALAGGGAFAAAAGSRVLALARMVLLVLIPLVGIGILLIITVVSFVPVAEGTTNFIPALIAGIAVSLGWIAGPIAQELRRSDEREERRRDMVEASAQEIWLIAKFAANLDTDAAIQAIKKALARDNRYEVMVLYRREYRVLSRLVDQIEILRKEQIDPVMSLFQLLTRLDQIEDQMGSEAFKKLPRPRREAAVERYYRMMATLPKDSVETLRALDREDYAKQLEAYAERMQRDFDRKRDGDND